jgi:hypothetical protein
VDDDHTAKRKAEIRAAIVQYLQRFPLAGDTPEGIAACWMPSSGNEDALTFIGAVVEAMVTARELKPRNLPDGLVLYLRGPALSFRD